MKKLLLLVCLLAMGQLAMAQGLDSIFAECKSAKGAMQVNLSKEMIQLAMAMDKNAQSATSIMKKMDNMKMVVIPKPDAQLQSKVFDKMSALESPKGYTKVLTAEEKDKGTQQLMLIRSEGAETDTPIVTEFAYLAVVTEKGQPTLILTQVTGRFDVDDLQALAKVASRR